MPSNSVILTCVLELRQTAQWAVCATPTPEATEWSKDLLELKVLPQRGNAATLAPGLTGKEAKVCYEW